jgi:hypothetical protein
MEKPEILFYPSPALQGNRMFDLGQAELNRDNGLRVFYETKKELGRLGYDVRTIDMARDLKKAAAVIFHNVPKQNDGHYLDCLGNGMQERMYLMLEEPHTVYAANYDKANHKNFRRILTWYDPYVDNARYFKYFFPNPIQYGQRVDFPNLPFGQKKLLCMISGNKYMDHPLELYSERRRAVRYLEREHLADFDLYGTDWEVPVVYWWPFHKFKINILMKLACKRAGFGAGWQYPSYRGAVRNKLETLGKYRFSICYENQKDTPGYVSEKMIDAFLAGNVPIYYGNENCKGYVPDDCFINRKKFSSFAEVYDYAAGMSEGEHNEFQGRILEFLNSRKVYPFTITAFVEKIKLVLDLQKG